MNTNDPGVKITIKQHVLKFYSCEVLSRSAAFWPWPWVNFSGGFLWFELCLKDLWKYKNTTQQKYIIKDFLMQNFAIIGSNGSSIFNTADWNQSRRGLEHIPACTGRSAGCTLDSLAAFRNQTTDRFEWLNEPSRACQHWEKGTHTKRGSFASSFLNTFFSPWILHRFLAEMFWFMLKENHKKSSTWWRFITWWSVIRSGSRGCCLSEWKSSAATHDFFCTIQEFVWIIP